MDGYEKGLTTSKPKKNIDISTYMERQRAKPGIHMSKGSTVKHVDELNVRRIF
jgi:hypothetical protein